MPAGHDNSVVCVCLGMRYYSALYGISKWLGQVDFVLFSMEQTHLMEYT